MEFNGEIMAKNKKKNYEIGRTTIKDYTKFKLWALSGGRCEICNNLLFKDDTYGFEGNFSNIAHIIGIGDNGPRTSRELGQDKNNFENLMLLCTTCHHGIDTNTEFFTTGYLIRIKKEHEKRVEYLTGIDSSKECQIVTYLLNVNEEVKQYSSQKEMLIATANARIFPKQNSLIDLCDDGGTKYTPSKEAIIQKAAELEETFSRKIRNNSKDVLAIFAFACQPLLFKLGSLFGDQRETIVFQPQRNNEKNRWSFKTEESKIEFLISSTNKQVYDKVALVIDLSAPIVNDRIIRALGESTKIYHLSVQDPNRNFVTSQLIQNRFVESFRQCIEMIKNENSGTDIIHIFPAMPISLAIRAGMDFMPKADLKWLIYEQSNKDDGFYSTIIIGG